MIREIYPKYCIIQVQIRMKVFVNIQLYQRHLSCSCVCVFVCLSPSSLLTCCPGYKPAHPAAPHPLPGRDPGQHSIDQRGQQCQQLPCDDARHTRLRAQLADQCDTQPGRGEASGGGQLFMPPGTLGVRHSRGTLRMNNCCVCMLVACCAFHCPTPHPT